MTNVCRLSLIPIFGSPVFRFQFTTSAQCNGSWDRSGGKEGEGKPMPAEGKKSPSLLRPSQPKVHKADRQSLCRTNPRMLVPTM